MCWKCWYNECPIPERFEDKFGNVWQTFKYPQLPNYFRSSYVKISQSSNNYNTPNRYLGAIYDTHYDFKAIMKIIHRGNRSRKNNLKYFFTEWVRLKNL